MEKQISKTGKKCSVTFSLPAEAAGTAKEVWLLGDFNEWDPANPIVLQRRKDGSFQKKVSLPLGMDYQFRYYIDQDHWQNDPQADRYEASLLYPHVENSVVCLEEQDN